MIPVSHFLVMAAVLFSVGALACMSRRNAISVLIGVELMLNAVNINFLAFSRATGSDSEIGFVFVVFIITIAAAEAAVGLAILLAFYRQWKTADIDRARMLQG